MPADEDSGPRQEGEFPPPPPVDAPTSDPSSRSFALGVVIGLVATGIGSFVPLLASSTDDVLFGAFWLIPIVLVVGVALTVVRSTRRTGAGMLLGFAVGLVVSAGTCVVLLSTGVGLG